MSVEAFEPVCQVKLSGLGWRTSSYSTAGNATCIEVAFTNAVPVGVRDSKNPEGGQHQYGIAEFAAFIAHIKRGAFNDSIL